MAVRPGIRLAASVALLGGVVVACSGDDDAADGTAAPPADSSATQGTAGPSSSPTTDGESADGSVPPTTASAPTPDECPFMAAEEVSAIMDDDLVLPPAAVAIDPVGRKGASCGFVNPAADSMVTIIMYDEQVPGAIADEIASHRENEVTFVEVEDFGTRAIATGGGGALSLAAEAEAWYLIVSVVSPPADGADPFTPDGELLDKVVELARAVVQ